jgi:hypothetical protein
MARNDDLSVFKEAAEGIQQLNYLDVGPSEERPDQ